MSESSTADAASIPRRDRSIEARRIARQAKAKRERRIVNLLCAGVSVAELAAREGVTHRRMRAIVQEILARRMPQPPVEFLALQITRLNEAMIVAHSAMRNGNLEAVDRVIKIVRELDRYHGFAAAAATGRAEDWRWAGDLAPAPRALEPRAPSRLEMAPQAIEIPHFAAANGALPQAVESPSEEDLALGPNEAAATAEPSAAPDPRATAKVPPAAEDPEPTAEPAAGAGAPGRLEAAPQAIEIAQLAAGNAVLPQAVESPTEPPLEDKPERPTEPPLAAEASAATAPDPELTAEDSPTATGDPVPAAEVASAAPTGPAREAEAASASADAPEAATETAPPSTAAGPEPMAKPFSVERFPQPIAYRNIFLPPGAKVVPGPTPFATYIRCAGVTTYFIQE